ncbi:MAG: hypothetical protein OHK0017_05920 [Patescibacteria group bacterium]
MHQSFFSSVSELLARVVALILVLVLFTVFFLAKGDFRLYTLVGFGAMISGSIILYELTAFVFYEIFSFVEQRAYDGHKEEAPEPELNSLETKSDTINLSEEPSEVEELK